MLFESKSVIFSFLRMCTKNAKIHNVCHWKVETCLSVQFLMLLSPTSPLLQDSIRTMKCRNIHTQHM